ncbi:MAG: 2-polyprenyl-6-hydroxyphenyl methylase/3-demethylubiquinone-9 3-methyltransferase [Gammaproteobacteria bacterium]|jgi:2-polyprenyl-6-hydroxyphenyl methylase/3-demethylubiquinone-9 3-methyltransferase
MRRLENLYMPNFDQKELAKFALLADSWWDVNGACKPLHDLNPCRGEFIAQRTDLAGARVLDVGCGGGILCEFLADAGATVTGIDRSEELIAIAQQHAIETGRKIQYKCCGIEEFTLENALPFDVVTCMELLEHVPNPQQMVLDCALPLAHSGNLFFSTINRTPKAYALAVIAAEYVLKLLPRGTHDYLKFIKPSELAKWGRDANLGACEFSGYSYNPVSRHAQLSSDLSVNFLAHFVPNP